MNTNCLDGLRCPNCGSEEPVWIEAKAEFKVYDSGTDEYHDVEWDENSPCRCGQCRHWSTVAEFRRPPEVYQCGNCGRTYANRDELNEIRDFFMRVDEGGPMPSGECAECGALCYLIEPNSSPTHLSNDALLDYWVRDWRIVEGEACPQEDQARFRLQLFRAQDTGAVRITITEEGNAPGLDLLVEINHGRPCVHIGVVDTDAVCHAFGMREGVVLVPDGATNRPRPWPADRRWYDDPSAMIFPADAVG